MHILKLFYKKKPIKHYLFCFDEAYFERIYSCIICIDYILVMLCVAERKNCLKVKKIDYLIDDNTKDHKTHYYTKTKGNRPKLVVRRGQTFEIKVYFDREYDKEDDIICIYMETGSTATNILLCMSLCVFILVAIS